MEKNSAKNQAKLVLFNKPFNVLTQFTDSQQRSTLADYLDIPDIYPAGRLDRDSEGLLLLTDNGRLQHLIANPREKTWKTYIVQVEGNADLQAVEKLQQGVQLKDGLTRPAQARIIDAPQWLWPRNPPVRFRKTVPDHWLEIKIHEGKNRQVRRMTAAVGLPTLRLIRTAIGQWQLGTLQPGEFMSKLVRVNKEHSNELDTTRHRRHHRRRSGKVSRRPRKNQ